MGPTVQTVQTRKMMSTVSRVPTRWLLLTIMTEAKQCKYLCRVGGDNRVNTANRVKSEHGTNCYEGTHRSDRAGRINGANQVDVVDKVDCAHWLKGA